MAIKLPEGFTIVEDQLPVEDRPVLAIRLAAHTSATFEVMTARYQPGYRPHSPWRDLGNDAVTDSGKEILGWRYADEWLLPTGRLLPSG